MNIKQVYIQEEQRGKLRIEEQLVSSELKSRGCQINYFSSKHIRRRSLPLNDTTLVVGDMNCIYGAMKQLGIPIPKADSYPKSLSQFLYREVKLSRLKDIEASLFYSGGFNPIFIKPAHTQKKFTGFVLESEQDLYKLSDVSKQIEIWCSQIVKWLSEWRVYVVNYEIRAISWYEGDIELKPDKDAIGKAISLLRKNGDSPKSFAIDFGVLSSGETALIEMNDGFAVGAYEVTQADYTDMVVSRWQELLDTIKS